MGYSLKESCNKMKPGQKQEDDWVCHDDTGGTGDQRIGLLSSSNADNQRTSDGFIKQVDQKDQVVERLNPSNSGSSISSMNVVSNDTCKPKNDQEANPSKAPFVGSSQSLEELEGRQEPSPHPSSSSSKLLHVSSSNNNSNNREKASPLPDRLADAQTTVVPKHHFHAGPSIEGFRPPPHSGGYRPAPPPYQQHYHHDPRFHHHHHPLYISGPPPGQHSYGYSTPYRQRYPTPVYHPTPTSSAGAKIGIKTDCKSSNVEGAGGSSLVKREGGAPPATTSLGKKEDKRNEALPLKKRKLIDFSDKSGGERVDTIKAISVDDHERNEKINGSAEGDYGHDERHVGERQSYEEQYYARYHTPRYSGTLSYPPPYHHHHYGHYYSPSSYHPPESDYYSPPRSHVRHHYYVQPPNEHQHNHLHQQRLSVSPTDEVCRSNDEPIETLVESEEQEEYSSRMDNLATAADTLEIRSETSAKAEEDGGEDGDDDKIISAKATSQKKCVTICNSLLTKFLQKRETESLPAFAEIVNYPEYLPDKGSPSKKSDEKKSSTKQRSEKPCVMCGKICIFAGTTPSRLHTQKKQSIIPKQNKGLCNSCDGKTWLFSSDMDAAIKWCKGCKNFRLLQSFGEKYRATKCVRCRERQRENYAELKKKRDVRSGEGANLLLQQKMGWGSASDESERGSPELDAALGLASLC